MADRSDDWYAQAERDLESARWQLEGETATTCRRGTRTDGSRGAPWSSTPRRTRGMPSAVRKRSYGSVRVFWLDREGAIRCLTAAA